MTKKERMEFLMEKELHDSLKQYSELSQRSKGDIVREALKKYLSERDQYDNDAEYLIQSFKLQIAEHENDIEHLRKLISELRAGEEHG